MKKALISVIILLIAFSVFSQDLNSSFKIGFQACSDSSLGIVLKAGHFESGLKARLELYDPGDELLVAGAYLAWLFNSKDGMSSLGIGADFRNGFGSGIAEHVDLYARLSYNYHLSEHFMLTGIFYPFSLSTRETEGADDWSSTATVSSAAVAVTVFL
jgi:hypothetical protein